MTPFPTSFASEPFAAAAHGFCLHAHAVHAGEIVMQVRADGPHHAIVHLTARTDTPRLPAAREGDWNPLVQALLDHDGIFTLTPAGSDQPTSYHLPSNPGDTYRKTDHRSSPVDPRPGFTFSCRLSMPVDLARRLAHYLFDYLPTATGPRYVLDLPGSPQGPRTLQPRDALAGAAYRATHSTPHGDLEFGVFETYAAYTVNAGGRLRAIALPFITPAYVATSEDRPVRSPRTFYCRIQTAPGSPLAHRYWHDAGAAHLDDTLRKQLRPLVYKTLYDHFASDPRILPTYAQWQEARALGIDYPEPPAIANAWEPTIAEYAEATPPAARLSDANPRHDARPLDLDNTLVVMPLSTTEDYLLERLASLHLQDKALVHANDQLARYSWSRHLPVITGIEARARTQIGDVLTIHPFDADEMPPELSVHQVEYITANLTVHDPRTGTDSHPTYSVDAAAVLKPGPFPQGHLYLADGHRLTIERLQDLLTEAGFSPTLDLELDGPDTQHQCYRYDALCHLSRVLDTPAERFRRRFRYLLNTHVLSHLNLKQPMTVHITPDTVSIELHEPPPKPQD